MPIEIFLEHDDGSIYDYPPLEPGETFYCPDYTDGKVSRVIGIESPLHDMYGVVYVLRGEETLETLSPLNQDEEFVAKVLGELVVSDVCDSMEVSDQNGNNFLLTMDHILPDINMN